MPCPPVLDESERLDQGGRFALSGVAVRDDDWAVLQSPWQGTLADAAWPLDREVKWHGIRTGELPPVVADAIFAEFAAAPLSYYVAVMDLNRGPEEFPPAERAFFRSPEDVYATRSARGRSGAAGGRRPRKRLSTTIIPRSSSSASMRWNRWARNMRRRASGGLS